MGRSLTSCFKIMYCVGYSANNVDGLAQPESKTLPGKRTWSFQKRSFTHHVPSNHVISESVSIVNDKHDLEAAAGTANSEKASVSQRDTVDKQTNQTPASQIPSMESEQFTSKSTDKFDYNIDEDVVVVIQASIRGYLAKRELEKIRKVVKLQAAIRRYLVRRQAVGTLRCIQAIFKIQQIVRDRHAIQSKEFASKEKLNEERTAEMVKSFEMKPNKTPLAIKKLTSNSFASQLLKSTLETNSIHISCNPLRPDSGWIWLERWMALTSSDQQKIIFNQDDPGEDVSTVLSNKIMSNQDDLGEDVNSKFQITPEHMSSDNKLLPCDPTSLPAEVEGYFITKSSENNEIEVPSSLQDQISNSLVQNLHLKSHNDETWLKNSSDFVERQIPMITEPVSHFELISHSNIPDYPEETYKNNTKKEDHVTAEMEVGQVLTESRKSRNPGFAAVQAKFEELSATSSSTRSLSNTFRDTKSDSKSAHASSKTGEGSETNSVYLNTGDMRNTITLSDRSEAELSEISSKIRTSKENACTISITNFSIGDTNVETDDLSCDSDAVQGKIIAKSSENATSSGNAAALVQVEQKSEESVSLNTQVEGSTKGPLADRPSQEGSPISHITVPEFNGTSSSLISMHVKTNKAENITPIRKKRPQIAINNSPTDSKNDSGEQTSEEHLKKGVTKIAKRRNSFSMVKTDHEHQTSSSNLLRSYMKPTESTKAKVSTSISQKSSPDMHEKDNHVKKRHSLPNGDERQGSSPRMQRSTSQVQQNLKGNGTDSPQNSTERRWIR